MRFAALTLLAAALGVACAFLVACGGNDDKLLPDRDAAALKAYADRVGQAVAASDCQAAQSDVQAAIARIGELPPEVDQGLRQNLEEGFTNLSRQAATACQATTQPTETTDTTPTETTETTETTDTTTTETTETETTDTNTTDTTDTTDTGTTTEGRGDGGSSGDQGSADGGSSGDQGSADDGTSTGDQGSGGTGTGEGTG